MNSCFITGTDTDVGKTVMTAGLAGLALSRGLRVCVYKPVQTGCPPDAEAPDPGQIRQWCGDGVATHVSYCFAPPVAPYAADPERTIRTGTIFEDFRRLKREYDVVLVEGAGGVRVPIAPRFEMIDLMRALGLPIVVVARPNLGTINHTLLTVGALRSERLEVAGVVISGLPDASEDPAVQTLERTLVPFLEADLLAMLPRFELSPGCFAPGSEYLKAFESVLSA